MDVGNRKKRRKISVKFTSVCCKFHKFSYDFENVCPMQLKQWGQVGISDPPSPSQQDLEYCFAAPNTGK